MKGNGGIDQNGRSRLERNELIQGMFGGKIHRTCNGLHVGGEGKRNQRQPL